MTTQSRIKELLDYNPETGALTWKATRGGGIAGADAGYIRPDGYVRISIDGKLFLAHRIAWLYVHGDFPENDIDHINSIRDDNRLCNLRSATRSQNKANSRKYKNNSTGFKGIYWDKQKKKFRARIRLNNKKKHIGYFDTAPPIG